MQISWLLKHAHTTRACIELWGRKILLGIAHAGMWLGSPTRRRWRRFLQEAQSQNGLQSKPPKPPSSHWSHGQPSTILVVRIDERLGNAVMLGSLIEALAQAYPKARLQLLLNHRNVDLFASDRRIDHIWPFNKRRLLAQEGPFGMWLRLARQSFDLVIDAGNPTHISLTQAAFADRAARGKKRGLVLGAKQKGRDGFYDLAVANPKEPCHETQMRHAWLEALTHLESCPESLQVMARVPAPLPNVSPAFGAKKPTALAQASFELPAQRFIVLNLGARLQSKRLDAATYADILSTALPKTADTVGWLITYGPHETDLAHEVARSFSHAHPHTPNQVACSVAPPTKLDALAWIFARATAVVSCDTGPMHLAVAMGAPTCGMFLTTCPIRYGYDHTPHKALDCRAGFLPSHAHALQHWLADRIAAPHREAPQHFLPGLQAKSHAPN